MICATCKQDKSEHEFNFRDKLAGIYQRSCKECTRLAGRAHYERNKEKVIAKSSSNRKSGSGRYWYTQFKDTLVCEVCGEDHAPCLEFHHTNSHIKEKNPSSFKGWTDFKQEIKECVVVCANCHRKIHSGHIKAPSLSSLMDRALVFETSRWKFDSSLGRHNPRIKQHVGDI